MFYESYIQIRESINKRIQQEHLHCLMGVFSSDRIYKNFENMTRIRTQE